MLRRTLSVYPLSVPLSCLLIMGCESSTVGDTFNSIFYPSDGASDTLSGAGTSSTTTGSTNAPTGLGGAATTPAGGAANEPGSGEGTSTSSTSTNGNNSTNGAGGTNNPSSTGSRTSTGSTSSTGGTKSTTGATFVVPPDAKPTPATSGVPGMYRVNASGRLAADGASFQMRGGNWFGLEGQDDIARPGAMELYIGSVFWATATNRRTIVKTMQEITASPLNFNTIRLPLSPQTLVKAHPDGDYTRTDVKVRNNDPTDYPYADAREALEDFIKLADENNLYVILDIHSCSNHIGWRAGMIHDGPPWTDADRENYEYKKENYTCRSGEDEYTTEKWLKDVRTLAKLPKELGVDNVLGIDCFNEPFKYTWSQWADLAKQCYDAMAAENDDLIAFVEGVSGSWEDESGNKGDEPYGDTTSNPNWGENLYGQQFDPIQIPKDRLCFAPHTYGPSVYVQRQFIDQTMPACVGLEDDAAGKAKCKLVVERSNTAVVETLRKGWDARFGYLRKENYCVLMGEWGGYKTWPINPVEPSAKTVWAHLPTNVQYDMEWQHILADYMKDIGLTDYTYWSINPESGDTGGIYNHAYTESNKSGWGVWNGFDTDKVNLLTKVQ